MRVPPSLMRAGRIPCASPILTLIAAMIFLVPGTAALFEYTNVASISDTWRFLTSHWVHWSTEHLLWSGGAFLLLGLVCEKRNPKQFLTTVIASALAIPVALRVMQPELHAYGGLSGIDSALFGLLCVQDIRSHVAVKAWKQLAIPVALLAGFVGKMAYELTSGEAIFVSHSDAMVPVPLAHVVGMLVGVVIGLDLSRQIFWRRNDFRLNFGI